MIELFKWIKEIDPEKVLNILLWVLLGELILAIAILGIWIMELL